MEIENIHELLVEQQLIETLRDIGILQIEQIEKWSYPQFKKLKGISEEDAYRLELAIRQWVSGQPTEEEPIEYTCYINYTNVRCVSCGHEEAELPVGLYYPEGLKKYASDAYGEQKRYRPHFRRFGGIGGTIPLICRNCGERGTVDFPLEVFKKQFESIPQKLRVISNETK